MEKIIDIKKLLKNVVAYKASDLHLVSRSEPQIRVDGKLVSLKLPKLDGETIKNMCYSIITKKQKEIFEEYKELDFAIEISNIGRFRVNYYKTLNDVAAAFRVISTKIPSIDELDMPKFYKDLIKQEKGLILVTGPTGSGKSTTLASILNEINLTERKHIITIEDPVEFIHENRQSLFSHRNVGTDTDSFDSALKHALREDPDIIFIGEMRDKKTISAALTAAETGHLVFSTLHTNSAVCTINRIIDVFSADEQSQIRTQLSMSLVAVISQVLIPKIGGGRVVASEILIKNFAIANLIREGKIHQIYNQMQLGQGATKMQTQTQALVQLVKKGIIKKDDALRFSTRLDELAKSLSAINGKNMI